MESAVLDLDEWAEAPVSWAEHGAGAGVGDVAERDIQRAIAVEVGDGEARVLMGLRHRGANSWSLSQPETVAGARLVLDRRVVADARE